MVNFALSPNSTEPFQRGALVLPVSKVSVNTRLPDSLCKMTSSFTGNRPKGLSFGNEYGLYNEIDELLENVQPYPLTNQSEPPVQTSSKCKVVCEVLDKPSPLACRSFTTPRSFVKVASICIDGVRIVQDMSGEEAEYHINLNIDGRDCSSWRRYADFNELGDAFEDFCDGGLLMRRTKHLQKSLASWRMVQAHRPWLLRNVSVQFLQQESQLLETFLTSILHEYPAVDLIVDFVSFKK